ncbi:hypothetical protein M3Y97_00037600 [Aphelenchoides bicaudatus]|nr:hypothetical protein M3Y97_00037600 [Aphelenchoides bicaudatus]
MGKKQMEVSYKSDWRSLYILTIVAFLGAFKIGNNSNIWAYIKTVSHDQDVSESFLGYMISIANAGNLCAAFLAGWISNLLQHTKPALLTGKVFAIIGGVLFLLAEVIDSSQKAIFLAMELTFGVGLGFSSVARTYIAMASSEKSRSRAVAMISLAVMVGHATAPFVTGLMTRLKYPGYELGSTGLNLHLYSAPVYLLIITAVVSIVLLLICFDGKMRLMKTAKPIENGLEDKKIKAPIDPSTLPKGQRFDTLAVFICCATRLLSTVGAVYAHVLAAPYMMASFQWDGPQYVLINSIIHTINGLIGVAWSLIYISGCLKDRLSERRAIVIAILMKLMFFVVTYPWPVYDSTIQYEVLAVNETTNKTKILEHGCKAAYAWCKETPAINPWLYCVAKVLLLGVSMPLMHLNLDILYSKILGNIKQGTMQGAFIICGDILQVIGPVVITQVYKTHGVKPIWVAIIGTMFVILSLWLVFYRRMISSTRRMQQIVDSTSMDSEMNTKKQLGSKVSCITNSIGDKMVFKWKRRSNDYSVDTVDAEPRTDWTSMYIVALVAFIGSVHTHCINPAVWPYMKLLIPNVSENFFGLLNSLMGVGIVLAAPLAGFLSNYLKDTTLPMLTGKILAIVSCFLYMMIELVEVDAKYVLFVAFMLILGLSIGAANIYRTHVAMGSTEDDRPKAVAICNLAPAIGIFVGPVAQILFTMLGYPGIPLLFGTHLNLYTAPVIMVVLISLIGAFSLIFLFDGPEDKSSTSSSNSEDATGYDKVAFGICLYTRMLVNFCVLNINVVGIPYSMTAFQWSSEKSVLYISICMLLVGLNICFWNLLYIFWDLRKKLSERRAIIISIFGMLLAYVLTYPYPFIEETIPYQNLTGNGTELLGCKPEFKWCAETPRVNMYVFLGSLITVLGFSFPLCEINLNILFSKILGNIKQGTLQSLMIISGEILTIFGPILFTKVYTASGPTHLWQFEIFVLSISIVLWLIFYRRMIGKSKRLAAQSDQLK